MIQRKKGYWFAFVLTVLLTLAALSTVIPRGSAGSENYLGYKAVCPFAPFSTLICIALVAIICIVRSKKLKVKQTEEDDS